jgi:starch synthase
MGAKVLYIAAECKPFSKAGGVGDVAGELPAALHAKGVEIEVATPLYTSVPPEHVGQQLETFTVYFAGTSEVVTVYEGRIGDVRVNLIKNATYFEGTYGRPYVHSLAAPFQDDILRFSFFSKACIELVRRRAPDIVHINDWLLGYLFGWMEIEGFTQRRVVTIHNIGYQGNIWRPLVLGWDISDFLKHEETTEAFTDPRPEWDSVNPLRLAIELAHVVTTVSPTYASEITIAEDPERYFEGAKGLQAITSRVHREGRLIGILNGFEYTFEPTEQTFLDTLDRKAKEKRALAAYFHQPDQFLLGFVGRAVEQKFRLLTELLDGRPVLEHILDVPGINVAILATGIPEYESFIGNIGIARYPNSNSYGELLLMPRRRNYTCTIAFDKALSGRISLASDVFLMPSLFEPCGITQLEAMSNATPPLVRRTGGLADTVLPYPDEKATGFGFAGTTRDEILWNLISTVKSAVELYRTDRLCFEAIQKAAFYQRFRWSASAQSYIAEVYGTVNSAPNTAAPADQKASLPGR